MNRFVFFGALAATSLGVGVAHAATLDDVKARGMLNCGVNTGLVGFAAPDANGVWQGFDVALCRAIAAAVLSDPEAVNFIPTTSQTCSCAIRRGPIRATPI
jgi:general L-amino acid transport system substrate-binding protein